jgi:hypothetical protein
MAGWHSKTAPHWWRINAEHKQHAELLLLNVDEELKKR